jgi:hypothetical protein
MREDRVHPFQDVPLHGPSRIEEQLAGNATHIAWSPGSRRWPGCIHFVFAHCAPREAQGVRTPLVDSAVATAGSHRATIVAPFTFANSS